MNLTLEESEFDEDFEFNLNKNKEIISLMNLPLIKALFLIFYIIVFVLCVFGKFLRKEGGEGEEIKLNFK